MKIPRTQLYITPQEILHTLYSSFKNSSFQKGKIVLQFEKEFARFHGEEFHAIAMPFARIAFYFLLQALNLPLGSRVLLTPLTIADMVNMIRCAGLIPEFVDIRLGTYDMDTDQLKRLITPNTRVILVTHLFGICGEMDKIMEIANKHGLFVIEDCSQNLGAKFKGKYVGTYGDAGIFSLSSLKTCSTFYGGMMIIRDEHLAAVLHEKSENLGIPTRKVIYPIILKNLLFSFALSHKLFSWCTFPLIYFFEKFIPGLVKRLQSDNRDACLRDKIPEFLLFRYTDLQAEVGLRLLSHVHIKNRKRRENANILSNILKDFLPTDYLPCSHSESEDVYWRYPLLIKDPYPFQMYLLRYGIDSSQTNLVLCSSQDYFKPYQVKMPIAERVKKELVFIPVEPSLSCYDMERIGLIIKDYFL